MNTYRLRMECKSDNKLYNLIAMLHGAFMRKEDYDASTERIVSELVDYVGKTFAYHYLRAIGFPAALAMIIRATKERE